MLCGAGASFSEDGTLLLLVATGGWALLQAADWDGQGVPTYTRLLHFAPQSAGSAGAQDPEHVELAGGAILSGAMAADRTRVDHYYAGVSAFAAKSARSRAGSYRELAAGIAQCDASADMSCNEFGNLLPAGCVAEGAVETVVLWWTDGTMGFQHVATAAEPPHVQPVARVAPADSSALCGHVDVAFLGSSSFARLCGPHSSGSCAGGGSALAAAGPAGGCAAGPRLSVYRLPYLFPNMAAAGATSPSGGNAAVAGGGSPQPYGWPVTLQPLAQAADLNSWGAVEAVCAIAAGAAQRGTSSSDQPCVTVAVLAGSNSHAAEYVAQVRWQSNSSAASCVYSCLPGPYQHRKLLGTATPAMSPCCLPLCRACLTAASSCGHWSHTPCRTWAAAAPAPSCRGTAVW